MMSSHWGELYISVVVSAAVGGGLTGQGDDLHGGGVGDLGLHELNAVILIDGPPTNIWRRGEERGEVRGEERRGEERREGRREGEGMGGERRWRGEEKRRRAEDD